MADLPVTVRPGVVVPAGSGLAVNVDGAVFAAPWWPAGYAPAAGDKVRVLVQGGEATVLSGAVTVPRQQKGTVAGSAVSGLLPVTVGAFTVQAQYLGTAPSIGTLVLLMWEGSTPWVVGAAAAATLPPPAYTPPPPPPVTNSGTETFTAVDSGSRTSAGSWYSRDVRQGTYAGVTYVGAWFYGSQPARLAGATVTGVRLRLGARLRIGSYNAGLTVHTYRVVEGSRPSGSPTFTDGPTDIGLAVNAPAGWVGLPNSVGQNLINAGSGGMGLTGSGYGGVEGNDSDPASGQLQIDWKR